MEIQHIIVQFTHGAPSNHRGRTIQGQNTRIKMTSQKRHMVLSFRSCRQENVLMHLRPTVTLKMYTFCPQNSFVCFVRVAEHTTIISVYSINWLVFITETESVYCAVRAEYLKPWLRELIAGLSPPRYGFVARSVHVRFVVDKGGTRTGFSPSTSFFPPSVSPH